MTLTADAVTHRTSRRRPEAPAGRPRWATSRVLWLCSSAPPCSTCGASARRAGPTSYYAAAAQAGTQDWKAWLFGSLDAGNSITVDKPPAAMWVMGLSGRLFGFNAFTMLLPQALMGVGCGRAAVRHRATRSADPVPGLIAGAVLALTPVAALMFRFNNPDALLVLLLGRGGVLHRAGHRADGERRRCGWR